MKWVGKNPLNRKVLKASDTITSGIKSNYSNGEEGGKVYRLVMKRTEKLTTKTIFELYSDLFKKKGMLQGELWKVFKIELHENILAEIRPEEPKKYLNVEPTKSIKLPKKDMEKSIKFQSKEVIITLIDLSKKRSIIKINNNLHLNHGMIIDKKGREDLFRKQMIQIMAKYPFLKLIPSINTTR